MLTNSEIIQALNGLIETCKDGQEGFQTAAAGVSDSTVRQILLEYSEVRARFAGELQTHVLQLGGEPETAGSAAAAYRRGWTNLKDMVTGKNEGMMLEACVLEEEAAVNAYRAALDVAFPAPVLECVRAQCEQISGALVRIRELSVAAATPTVHPE